MNLQVCVEEADNGASHCHMGQKLAHRLNKRKRICCYGSARYHVTYAFHNGTYIHRDRFCVSKGVPLTVETIINYNNRAPARKS